MIGLPIILVVIMALLYLDHFGNYYFTLLLPVVGTDKLLTPIGLQIINPAGWNKMSNYISQTALGHFPQP